MFLTGRDPLRNIPEKGPIAKQKPRHTNRSNGLAEDLPVFSEEARDHLYRKMNRQNKLYSGDDILMITSKSRATSLDYEIWDKNAESVRPNLKMRSFSAGGVFDHLLSEREQLKKRKPDDKSSKQSSKADKSLSNQSGSSAIDSEYSELEETRLSLEEKCSPQFGARNSYGRDR